MPNENRAKDVLLPFIRTNEFLEICKKILGGCIQLTCDLKAQVFKMKANIPAGKNGLDRIEKTVRSFLTEKA